MAEKFIFPVQQLVDGHLVEPPQEGCMACAKRVFLERQKNGDTNPRVVQMKVRGSPIPLWYYRSDQWIEQPYLKLSELVQPYVGPAGQAMPSLYGERRFIVDREMTAFFSSIRHIK